MLNVNDLRFCVFNPIEFDIKNVELKERTYSLWRKNWYALFEELQKSVYQNSDEFSKQKSILTVNTPYEAVAAVGLRYIDLREAYGWDDSYAQGWPVEFLKKVRDEQGFLAVLSGFTINTQFQRKIAGLPTFCMWGAMIVRHLKTLNHRYTVTITRNDAGVNKLSERYGATTILSDLEFHGKLCDFVCFDRETINLNPWPKYEEEFNSIFNNNKARLVASRSGELCL